TLFRSLLDLSGFVDRPLHLVLAADHERDVAAGAVRLRRRIVGHRRLDEACRRRPDGEHALRLRIGRGRRRRTGHRRHVPRVVTADDLYLALLTEEGRAAAFWHHGAHFTHQLHAGAVGLEVNQARVALDG